jgi:glycosyltransferase involved in cell wall biosynthesis
MSSSADGAQPIAALLVATWYPSINDPGRGRFVADQAEALMNTGNVRPVVASFDIAYVDSGAGVRHARAVTAHLRDALAFRTDVVSPGGWSAPAAIGIARLPAPESSARAPLPPGQEADRRRDALELLAERLDMAGVRGIVHAHTTYPDGYAAAGAAQRLGWPLVITEHASFVARQLRVPEHRRRYIEAVRAASRVIAVSDMLASELREAIPEVADKLLVIPNVIALDAFTPAGPEQRHPDELLFVGDRKERKGMVVLLRAFADVLERRPSATLRLIGTSPSEGEEARWHQLATDLGVADAVRFEGPTDRAGIAAALRRATVFVHPSPRETFGVVTLEALAAGLPVVATESGGISAILKDDRLGALVPPQDSRMLARAVLRTIERRAEFDPHTLRSAVEDFSGPSVAPRLAAVYEDVIAEAGVARADAPTVGSAVNWAGRAEPIGDSLVVLAHDTDRAARVLSRMPSELLTRITLVTHGDPASAELPSGIERVVPTAEHITRELRRRGLGGPRGRVVDRLLRLVKNPVGPIRHRLLSGGLAELRWQANVRGIGRAVGEIAPPGRDRTAVPEIICLDVLDYAAAAPIVAAGQVRAAPGGLSWLADRWSATQAAGGRSPAAAKSADSDAAAAPRVG